MLSFTLSIYDKISSMPERPKIIRYLIGALIFIVTFIIYIKTLCPTVSPRDSGELITAAYTLGIAHPPGYPLYVLLGKLFSFVPFGSIAWRVNLMSAFFASSTVTLSYFIILRLTQSILAGTIGSLLIAFSPIFWSLAVVAEVFQLNIFFVALTIQVLWLWQENRDFRMLLLFAFIYGLSLTNHHSMLLLAPGFLYFVWITEKEILFKIKNWALLGVCFLLGLLPYLYLPLRSLANPYIDWGDPQTLDRFLAVVTRKQFGSARLDPSLPQAAYTPEMIIANLKTYLGWLISQFNIAGFLLGLTGIIISFQKNRKMFNYFGILFLFTGLFFVLLAAYPFHISKFVLYCSAILMRFMLPSFLIFSFWIGIGFANLLKWISIQKYKLFIIGLLLIIPIASLLMHYRKVDMSNYYYVEDLINNIMLSTKPGSIIFGSADTALFSLWYMQGVEGKRPDLKIISSTPQRWRAEKVMREWPELVGFKSTPTVNEIEEKINSYANGFAFYAEIIKRNTGKLHIYTDVNDSLAIRPFFDLLAPSGMIFEILGESSNKAKLKNLKENYHLWEKYTFRSDLSKVDMEDYASREILTFYAEGYNFSGLIYAFAKQYAKAKEEFNKALEIYPGYLSATINLKKLKQVESTE